MNMNELCWSTLKYVKLQKYNNCIVQVHYIFEYNILISIHRFHIGLHKLNNIKLQ